MMKSGLPSLIVTSGLLLAVQPCQAQIAADGTLPTLVQSPDLLNFEILNGDRQGNNLFHSFSQFSVPSGGSAHFQNAVDVRNIIGRVTGGIPSNIEGLIRANGDANLFLINPSGIVFGAGARLDIGGSFFATTGDRIQFADNTVFSALDTNPNPLLTISAPIGLQLGGVPGAIALQPGADLWTQPGRGISLVGGEIQMTDSDLEARGGRIELASFAGAGTVGLTAVGTSFRLGVPADLPRADIRLSNTATVDVRAVVGGEIAVYARDLNLSGESDLLAGVTGVGNLNTRAGDINVDATGTIRFNSGSYISNELAANSVGNYGDININTGSLIGTQEGVVSTTSRGRGQGGNIRIQAQDAIRFEGEDSGIFSELARDAVGQGGNITITTGTLSLLPGGVISSSVHRAEGNGGNINIQASGAVLLQRTDLEPYSGIISEVFIGRGNGGNIDINAASLSVINSELIAGLYDGSVGNAGNKSLCKNLYLLREV
jgi:filamentous hemagglutinin family protein